MTAVWCVVGLIAIGLIAGSAARSVLPELRREGGAAIAPAVAGAVFGGSIGSVLTEGRLVLGATELLVAVLGAAAALAVVVVVLRRRSAG